MEKIPKKVLTIRRVYSILVIVLRNKNTTYATVAQLVEYDLAKVGVAGSSPVCRSFKRNCMDMQFLFLLSSHTIYRFI